MVPEFKKLWVKDKSKDKKTALDEISFVVFLCDNSDKNPYKNYSESDRESILLKDFNVKERDTDINAAVEKYKKLNVTRYERAVKAALQSLDKIERYYNYIDTLPIEEFDVNEVLGSTEKLGKAIKSLRELEKQLEADRQEGGKVRGGNTVGEYEIPRK